MRCFSFLLLAAAVLAQGGTEHKPKAEDYEVHGKSKDVAIGAEFMIHSFSGKGETYIAKDYLVVEVALYPPKDESITVSHGRFGLRMNGKKQVLLPVPAQMVAAALQHPEWQTGRLQAGGGMGPIIMGRPNPTDLPGGPQPRVPTQPRAPKPDAPGGYEPEPRVPPHQLVVETVLPEGRHVGPISGFLYFPYKGKTTSINTLELLYEDAVIPLR